MNDRQSVDAAASEKVRPVFVEDFARAGRRHLLLWAAILGSAMGFIDGTVVTIAMPAIRSDLGASLDQATWINNAYMLTLSALILTAGALSDRFGLAAMFRLGLVVFVAASLLCALAPGPDLLIYARALQGTGAAVMVPGSLAMISRAYPREERGRAIGLWAAASALTTASGPIVGGAILSFGGPEMWRGIFAINLPLGALALALLLLGTGKDTRRPGEAVDVAGAALAVLGLGLLAWALTHLEASNDMRVTLATGMGGLAALSAFLWQEHRSPHPMLPLRLFRNTMFAAANIATFLLYFALSAILFFLPLLTVAAWDITEVLTILAFAPLSAAIALLSTRFGRMADQRGPLPLIVAGALVAAAGFAILALTTPLQAFFAATIPAMGVVGLGMSMVVAPLSTAVMNAVPDHETGVASGVNNAISRIGGLMAVALMGSVATIAYTIAGGSFSYGEMQSNATHIAAMNWAFATVAWVCAGFAALAALTGAIALRRQAGSS